MKKTVLFFSALFILFTSFKSAFSQTEVCEEYRKLGNIFFKSENNLDSLNEAKDIYTNILKECSKEKALIELATNRIRKIDDKIGKAKIQSIPQNMKDLATNFGEKLVEEIDSPEKYVHSIEVKPKELQNSITKFQYKVNYPYRSQGTNLDSIISEMHEVVKDEEKPLDKYSENDQFVYSIFQRLYNELYLTESKRIYDSAKSVLQKTERIDEKLFVLFQMASLYHNYDRLSTLNNEYVMSEIKGSIEYSISISSKVNDKGELYYRGLAFMENLIASYYDKCKDSVLEFYHRKQSIANASKALGLNNSSILYPRNLMAYSGFLLQLKNQLTTYQINELNIILTRLSESMNRYQTHREFYYISIKEQFNRSGFNSDTKNNEEMNRRISRIEKIKTEINSDEKIDTLWKYTLQLNLEKKLSDIYRWHIIDSSKMKDCIKRNGNNFISICKKTIHSQLILDELENESKNFNLDLETSFIKEDQLKYYKEIIHALETSESSYLENKSLAFVYLTANSKIGKLHLQKHTKEDSTSAAVYLAKSIEAFESADYLNYYKDYSEDYQTYCEPFSNLIKIYINQGNYSMAKKYYKKMNELFGSIFSKYQFDFYLIQYPFGVSFEYGKFLFDKGKFNEALEPLRYGSFEGNKKCTKHLIDIFSLTVLKNKDSAKFYQERIEYQADNMKKFSVPIACGTIKTKVDVYILDRAKGHPYKGIRDQVTYFKEARGCEINEDVAKSFDEIQDLAWENNVSFQSLSLFAVNSADSIKLTNEFKKESKNVRKLITGKNVNDLKRIFKWYLNKSDESSAKIVLDTLFKQEDNAEIRDEVSMFYLMYDGDNRFEELFLKDSIRLDEFRNYFHAKGEENLLTDAVKRVHYINLFQLDVAYLFRVGIDNSEAKQSISNTLINASWYCLLTEKFKNVFTYLDLSDQISKRDAATSKRAHALLFTNNFEEAESLYKQTMYQKYRDDENYATFLDVYIADFKVFEEKGIKHPDMEKIKNLLYTAPKN